MQHHFDIKQGDCLELMKEIHEKSIDLILCDLPYGLTDCKWDAVIPLTELWAAYRRIIKPQGNVILFSQQPFTSALISSNSREFSHIWYWKKNTPTGHLNAKKMPLKIIEEIPVFVCNRLHNNNEGQHMELRKWFFDELKKSGLTRKDVEKLLNNRMASHYFTMGQQFAIPSERDLQKLQSTGYFQRSREDLKAEFERGKQGKGDTISATFNPQGVISCNINKSNNLKFDSVYSTAVLPDSYVQTTTNYPRQVLEFDNEKGIHPTQKPVALLEYLIRTYSNEGEIVLDNCMGSGSTGVAALNTGRNFIGYELTAKYFEIAAQRIKSAAEQKAAEQEAEEVEAEEMRDAEYDADQVTLDDYDKGGNYAACY